MRMRFTAVLACLSLAGCVSGGAEDIRWGTEGSIHGGRIVQVSPDDMIYSFSRVGAQPGVTTDRQGPPGTHAAVSALVDEFFADPPEGSDLACPDYGSDFIERSVGNTVLERVETQCPSDDVSAAMRALDDVVAAQLEGALE